MHTHTRRVGRAVEVREKVDAAVVLPQQTNEKTRHSPATSIYPQEIKRNLFNKIANLLNYRNWHCQVSRRDIIQTMSISDNPSQI
jgi:ribosomal protein L17